MPKDFYSSHISYQRSILNTLTILYNEEFEKVKSKMAPEECDLVINLIKEVDPELSNIIEKIDNSCKMHIKRDPSREQASVTIAPDGLPLIMIGTGFLYKSHEDQVFIIAHELTHYLLEHHAPTPEAIIRDLPCRDIRKLNELDAIFKKSYSRVKEYEADRYAILNLGINPDYGINWMKKMALKESYEWFISKTQFKSTHPKWGPRIAQLEQIKYDLSVGNLKSERKFFDWSAIANSNLEL